jgi:hypothetical protein
MSGHRTLVCATGLALAFSAGCAPKDEVACEMKAVCPTVELGDRVLGPDAGTLSFEFDGVTESYALMRAEPSSQAGACKVHYVGGTLVDFYTGDPLFLSCSSESGRWFELPVWLGDLRQRRSGTFKTTSGQYAASYGEPCKAGGSCPEPCTLTAPKGSMMVTVEDAVGGAMKPPGFVTSDYERTVRVDVDFAKLTPSKENTGISRCQEDVGVHGTVRFTLSADQYVVNKDARCLCGL